jgi:hypothetical protein
MYAITAIGTSASAGAHGPRVQRDLREQPRGEVLQRERVARPAAEEASEDRRGEQGRREEHEAGRHDAELERVERLVELERRERASREPPVHDVGGDRDVHEHEREDAETRSAAAHAAARALASARPARDAHAVRRGSAAGRGRPPPRAWPRRLTSGPRPARAGGSAP